MPPLELAKRVGYGALFVVAVPLLLVTWARRSDAMIALPAVGDPWVGGAVALAGTLLLLAGIGTLVRRGRGLPMNAFPPERLVREGVYRWVGHPIYLGFGLAVLGAALATRSPAGLWLVTPATWLAMAALVVGHERLDLRRRFGAAALARPRFMWPQAGEGAPEPMERWATLVRVLLPWLLTWLAVQALGRPPDAFSTLLPGEERWPVFPWLELPYISAYLVVPLAVFAARSRRVLRDFAIGGIAGTVVVTLCWLVIPVVATHRPFDPSGWVAALLATEQANSNNVAAFPAFHVLWAMLAARAWGAERGAGVRWLAWGWAALVAASTIGTGHHSVLDVAAGALLYLPLRDPGRTWSVLRRSTERLANSWREWRVGPVRFINHGLYAGVAAAMGVLVAGSAAGTGRELAVVWVGTWVLVGAASYAQVLEGSSRLLRPFGWYGGLIGGVLGILTSPLVGGAIMPLMAAFALAAPWIQLLGRLRCLVQGCCHGAPTSAEAGICYHQSRSRVAHLADLGGAPIYPTPLYSIGGNLVIGLLLIRMHTLGAPATLILGSYFLLAGLARFVEEAYRGEPQTPVVVGLRVYQWFAVGSVLAGIGITMVPMAPSGAGFQAPTPALTAWVLVMFLVFSAAMGLDFPGSDRRFSRLASAEPLETPPPGSGRRRTGPR
ncbi:MAG: prolipoprotein diacylglyceryl transferase family protein [Gemmatimonadales bacterium]